MILGILSNGKAVMDAGVSSMPLFWQIWINILGIVSISSILFIKKREAQFSILAMIANVILMLSLANYFGFERILGLGHAPWLILLVYLFTRMKDIDIKTYYGKYIRLLMVIISISLVIDVVDVIRYFLGII